MTVTHAVWEPYAGTAGHADAPRPVRAGAVELLVTGECRSRELGPGVVELELTRPASGGGVLRAEWRVPCVEATAYWTPTATDGLSWLPAAWSAPRQVSPAYGAPVGALVGVGDVGLCTFAAQTGPAEGREVSIGAGVVEETGEFRCWVQTEAVASGEGALGRLTVRIDTSRRHFGDCLAEVAGWWRESVERTAEVRVPDEARRPAYSTWYAMHQHVTPEAIELQAALGRELGLDTVIVDDGWMTGDRGRGYGQCGDWDPVSLPGTAAHVRRVHELGARYLLWFALPFVGAESSVWEEFRPYALARVDALDAIVVDPRYPVVRAHLADRLARPVEEWGMDGLKLDFIDRFHVADPPEPGPDADCASVAEGVERLLGEIRRRISAVAPHAMIETRQPYVSPALWPHATMIRAVDCPLGPAENRRRTVDARLVAGPLAVHADMLMWHPRESVEQLACHLVNVLFAVPQISVDLAALGEEHRETLAFWLGVFRARADLLQRGVFRPSRPDLGYPMVRSATADAVAVARYAALPVDASGAWRELLIANADTDPLVHLTGGAGDVHAVVRDARGRTVGEADLDLAAPGGARLSVPRGGLATLIRSATVDAAAR
ncbi:glycoside hydrolase family 36 protein [Streptacidiphilus rugosus]|uniref:glycoside hydrolase family 36 protein n=1 Tax=Streptacidiphilus rugosus TaxID=405783 RepID=UPI000B13E594|nr:glycoside hydrolase family 36 protein [Streptacidiphilus rugosus]